MITTKITVPDYVREYALSCFGRDGVVHFPDKLDIYHLLFDLLDLRPEGKMVDSGNLEISLPVRRGGKNTLYYNFLSERSEEELIKRLRTMFWVEVHEFMDYQRHHLGVSYNDSVQAFRERYHIESLSDDAFIKNYYRWRKKVREHGKRYKKCKKNR